MTRKVTAFLMTVCLLFAAEAKAITGNEWKGFSQEVQQAYIVGVIDTWSDVVGKAALTKKMGRGEASLNELIFTKLHECVGGKMPYNQVIAIVQKYVENNPASWHYGMADLVFTALSEGCGLTGK